ncbi:bifunctional diguanylate cyclase/phosphodiesterase [Psychrobacter sp. I-STPA6b]|uniref:sensor domain-containing protein n=1 Tax=Psychrobacter sp. I-STPA6b TaxID=2585718 RepID=UPI001D0CDB50|nr:bifunctional diguanylate cyclase/phosphodiesterase [Psychrobacter sp. I-STPA6b]
MVLAPEIQSHLLTQLCCHSEESIFILDHQFHYAWVNPSFEQTVGHQSNYLLGRPLSIYPLSELPLKDSSLLRQLYQQLDENGYFQQDIGYLSVHGQLIDANMTIWQISYQQSCYYVGLLRNTHSSKSTQHTLLQLSHYNKYTGLPNRRFFMTQLGEYILDTYQELVIVRLNIDHFDAIYSTLSDEQIKCLLQQLTDRINRLSLSRLKVFAHFSLSDFAMLFEVDDANSIREELKDIIHLCELPFTVGTESIYLHLSIGVSHYREHGEQIDVLVRAAEHALEYVKRQGGDGLCWYTHDLNPNVLKSMRFETKLRQAIAQKQFIAYYQPKYHLQTNKLIGFEALVRWQHPEKGILEPQHFLQTIIESHLSYELFCQMLQTVTQQINEWQNIDDQVIVCINADASEFRQSGFLPFIKNLLTANPKCKNKLHLEVTESSLMNKDQTTIQIFNQLHDLGILLALDDFGTGYASLSYLSLYHFDFIKIDKSFVADMDNDNIHLNIIKAIITLANNLNIEVIAEGIENAHQAQLLTETGCEYGQGYYFGRPMSAEKATLLLLQQKHS